MEVVLNHGRQQEYYRILSTKGIPGILYHEFPSSAHPSADFLVALYVCWVRYSSHHNWIAKQIMPVVQEKMRKISKGQQKALTEAIEQVVKKEGLRSQCYAMAFGTAENDTETAIRIVSHIADTLLEGNFIRDVHLPTLHGLLRIIASQKVIRTWNSFIKALHDGHAGATQAFQNLFESWSVTNEVPYFVPISALPNGVRKEAGPAEQLALAVPDEYVDFCNTHLELLRMRYSPQRESIAAILRPFWADRDGFQRQSERLWQEVVTDASCDLRADGSDSVEIMIDPLREHSVRRIQLIPKEIRPDIVAVVWYESRVSGRPFWSSYDVSSPDLKFPEIESPEEVEANLNVIVRSLYRYLAITGLWAICTGRHDKKLTHKAPMGNGANGHQGSVHPSRPHFRRIDHLGQHPTNYAMTRLANHWPKRTPPAGKTFVLPEKAAQHAPGPMVANLADLTVVCRLSNSYLHL